MKNVVEKCGKALIRPVPMRGNSLFDAIVRLLEFKALLAEICAIAEVTAFKASEIDRVKEQFIEEAKEWKINNSTPLAPLQDVQEVGDTFFQFHDAAPEEDSAALSTV